MEQTPYQIISEKQIYGGLKNDVERVKKDQKRVADLGVVADFWYGFVGFVMSGNCGGEGEGEEEGEERGGGLGEIFEERYLVLVTGFEWLLEFNGIDLRELRLGSSKILVRAFDGLVEALRKVQEGSLEAGETYCGDIKSYRLSVAGLRLFSDFWYEKFMLNRVTDKYKNIQTLVLKQLTDFLNNNSLFLIDQLYTRLQSKTSSTSAEHRKIELFKGGQKLALFGLNAMKRLLQEGKPFSCKDQVVNFFKGFRHAFSKSKNLYLLSDSTGPDSELLVYRKENISSYSTEIDNFYQSLISDLIKYIFTFPSPPIPTQISALTIIEDFVSDQRDLESTLDQDATLMGKNVFTGEWRDDINHLTSYLFSKSWEVRAKVMNIILIRELDAFNSKERRLVYGGSDLNPDLVFGEMDLIELAVCFWKIISEKSTSHHNKSDISPGAKNVLVKEIDASSVFDFVSDLCGVSTITFAVEKLFKVIEKILTGKPDKEWVEFLKSKKIDFEEDAPV